MTREHKHYHIMLKRLFANRPITEKIEYLRHISCVQIVKHSRETYLELRTHKHPAHGKCYVCGKMAAYEHHTVMLINGGLDNSKNRIEICHKCHKLIHPWMK